jgi:RNA polymerase sigma-70 factor, ECF subfamily
MLQYAKGDLKAFELLYVRHKGGLYRFCLRQLNNKALAEECFQEIWLKLINARVNYQPTALFTTFLYRIAQNHIIDCYRKNKKIKLEVELKSENENHQPTHLKSAAAPNDLSQDLIEQQQYQTLRFEITQLPLAQKDALLLKMDAGLNLDEIARILDCGRETVKSRLRYATQHLKKLLGDKL